MNGGKKPANTGSGSPVRKGGEDVTFGPATPDHVVLATAEARPEAVGAASGVAA